MGKLLGIYSLAAMAAFSMAGEGTGGAMTGLEDESDGVGLHPPAASQVPTGAASTDRPLESPQNGIGNQAPTPPPPPPLTPEIPQPQMQRQDPAVAPVPVLADQTPAVGLPKMTRIILEDSDNIPPTGQFFGINGKGYILKPGEPANVPQGIIDTLNNAIEAKAVTDPQSLRIIGYRDRLRFPYRVVG